MARFTSARLIAAATAAAALVVPVVAAAPAGAAGTVKSAVSLTAPTSAPYGTTISLTGTAWRYGTTTKLVSATIWLQRSVHLKNTWSNVTSTHTSSTGTFAFSVKQVTAYDYRAYYGGSAVYTANVSAVRYPAVTQNIGSVSAADRNWDLGTMAVGGTLYPVAPAGVTIWVQRYDTVNKVWKNYFSGKADGANTFEIRGNVPGSVGTYRVYAPVRYPYAAGYSKPFVFAHYKWRGAFKKATVATGGTNTPVFTVYAEDPNRTAADAFATSGGTVWADLNTVGCKRVRAYLANYADAPANVAFSGASIGVQVSAAQNEDTPGERAVTNTFSTRSTVRFQVADTTSTTGPDLYQETELLCAN
jgi:hypothetical protein